MQVFVLRTKTAKATTLDILATQCILLTMSDDLKTSGGTTRWRITYSIFCIPASATSRIAIGRPWRVGMLAIFKYCFSAGCWGLWTCLRKKFGRCASQRFVAFSLKALIEAYDALIRCCCGEFTRVTFYYTPIS